MIEPTRTRAGRRTRADAAWARVVTAASADDHQKTYASNVPLRGVIGFAATTGVGALLATAASCARFVLLAYRSAYGAAIDASKVLASRFVPTAERGAGSFCVDRAQQVYPDDGAATFTTELHQTLRAGAPEIAAPAFAQALADNATGLTGHGFPALLIEGDQDVAVRDLTQERLADPPRPPPARAARGAHGDSPPPSSTTPSC